jgi:hypothetical protein
MDFIERLFHVSPDGGSGSLEVAYVVAAVVIIVGFTFREPLRRAVQWRPRP